MNVALLWTLVTLSTSLPPTNNYELLEAGLPLLDSSSVGCFGDFNSDKHTDVFTISSDGSVRVYIYHKASSNFIPLEASITEKYPITNCIPGDFNYDGKLDLLVQGPDPERVGFKATIHLGFLTTFGTPFMLDPTLDQLIVVDSNNDLLPDLYGMSRSGVRTFWVNKPAPDGRIEFDSVPHNVPTFRRLSQPHSNAFFDMNGDCLPDLFVDATDGEQRRYELWINQKTNNSATNFVLNDKNTFVVRPGTGLPSFADFDGDGAIDVIFPVCESSNCSVHVFYNVQAPLCKSQNAHQGICRQSGNLCSADSDFKFTNFSSILQGPAHTILPDTLFKGFNFTQDSDLPPMVIRLSDVNMDGYPDLLLPLAPALAPDQSTLSIWINEPCTPLACGQDATDVGRRTFVRELAGNELLEILPGAYAAAAFDLHDDGTQDLIVLQRFFVNQTEITGHSYSAVTLVSTREGLTSFLTTMGSNGVCESWCPSPAWPEKFPDPKPYGVSQAGVTVKFTVTDLEGTKRMQTGAQLSQSAYLSLQLPYSLFGLGRTNNYIEELEIGFPITANHHKRQWKALIPNSQLAIFPYPPQNDIDWRMELFVTVGDWIVAVITGLFLVLFVLGTITLVLHFRAKRESQDEANRERLYAF